MDNVDKEAILFIIRTLLDDESYAEKVENELKKLIGELDEEEQQIITETYNNWTDSMRTVRDILS